MKKIKIVTDSTSYISKEYVEKENISVVPLNYIFGGETYKEGFKGEFDDFFRRLESTDLFPTTSQPAVGDFYQVFDDALKEYDEIVVILISSKLSGTYNSAVLARELLEERRISIIDSNTSASNLRYLVEDAVEMAKEGKSSEEIVDHIMSKKDKMKVYLTTGSLEYLSRGGRLSSLQSTLGNLLNIKPIIELKDGELELLEKLRGKSKAVSKIVSFINKDVEKIGICHILNLDEAIRFKLQLEELFPQALISIDDLGPVVGSHLGPKTLGICFY